MSWFKDFVIGIIIGGGLILPGVSGGVLAVIFGLYEKIIYAISHFLKDWKKNFLFLLPIILGLGVGVVIFGSVLDFVFGKYPVESCYTFIGLILGGVPVLFNTIKKKDKSKSLNIPVFVISLIASLALFVLGKNTLDINISANLNNGILSFFLLFLTGVLFISGKVIPGISSSFLLMLIGMYDYFLDCISHPFSLSKEVYLQVIPIGLGAVIGGILLVKAIEKLLKDHHAGTYSAIIGFVLGSVYAIYPGLSINYHGLIGLLLLIISFLASYKFSKSEKASS